MANQQQPSRPWFRLPSIARPVIDPTPAPATATAPPAPVAAPPAPVARPAFRPGNQTQDPTPAAPTQRSPPRPGGGGGGTTSVPTSPVVRPTAPSSSLPTSPVVPATTPTAPVVTTSSVPSSPKPRVSAPTSSLPTSPAARTTTPTAPSSPKPRVSAPTSSLPPSPTISKPALSSSVVNSPIPKPVSTAFSAPTSSPRKTPILNSPATSPIPTAVTTTTAAVTGATRPSPPTTTTTTVKQPAFQTTPPDSPKPKPTAPPPSPLILPPAKIKPEAEIPLEAEQKRVLVQKTISSDQNKPKPRLNGSQSEQHFGDALKSSIGNSGKKETPKDHGQGKEKSHQKKLNSEPEKGGMRVITIAGENKGAYMEVIRSPNRKNQVFEGISHNLQKSSGSSSSSSSSSSEEEEGRFKKKMEKSQKGKTMSSGFMSTFMNSNVQGVNNSIVYNSSCSHHDPGVHLALSRKPAAGKDHRSNGN
ncbi:SH3 domain-containing protein C23A1.17 [Euphorbia lathyris]|uniref:SH3 domain-containing protein C23A1.17 n=1 Tax=Euphorbia lathyris TaxID=212925 RepID=UPI003314095C